MPEPQLRKDFTNLRTPAANELTAEEYNLNATRTDEALDLARQLDNVIDGGTP